MNYHENVSFVSTENNWSSFRYESLLIGGIVLEYVLFKTFFIKLGTFWNDLFHRKFLEWEWNNVSDLFVLINCRTYCSNMDQFISKVILSTVVWYMGFSNVLKTNIHAMTLYACTCLSEILLKYLIHIFVQLFQMNRLCPTMVLKRYVVDLSFILIHLQHIESALQI